MPYYRKDKNRGEPLFSSTNRRGDRIRHRKKCEPILAYCRFSLSFVFLLLDVLFYHFKRRTAYRRYKVTIRPQSRKARLYPLKFFANQPR